MAGLLVDSRVDALDLAAMVVDLVMRGWLVAERCDGAWILGRPEEPPVREDRSVAERRLEQALLPRGGSLGLAHPRGISAGELSRVRAALREQAVEQGWYRRDPQPGAVRRLAGRVPRTALGTAVRVQTLVAGNVVQDPPALQGLFQLDGFAATGVGQLAGELFAEDGLLTLGGGADLFGDLFDTIVEAVGAFDTTDLFG